MDPELIEAPVEEPVPIVSMASPTLAKIGAWSYTAADPVAKAGATRIH